MLTLNWTRAFAVRRLAREPFTKLLDEIHEQQDMAHKIVDARSQPVFVVRNSLANILFVLARLVSPFYNSSLLSFLTFYSPLFTVDLLSCLQFYFFSSNIFYYSCGPLQYYSTHNPYLTTWHPLVILWHKLINRAHRLLENTGRTW